MPKTDDAERVARSLGLGAFAFGSLVSLVVLLTGDRPGVIDGLLLLVGPPLLGALFYWVGLMHDPDASD